MKEINIIHLLDMYEPGMTVEILDQVFSEVRDGIVELLKKIEQSPNKPDISFLLKHFPKEKQKDFSIEILKQMGYDFDAGQTG